MLESKTLEEYIQHHQIDGVLWKANKLLNGLTNPILRDDNVKLIAQTLSLIPDTRRVMRDDYAKKICKAHDLVFKSLEKMIADFMVINTKKENIKKTVRKNKLQKIDGDPKKFPFLVEFVKEDKNTGARDLTKIKIDKYKFVQLLSTFGFTRYETGMDGQGDGYSFVRLKDNVITSVLRDQIIDYIETFVKHEYDFDGAGYEFVDAEILINTFYDQIRTIFSKDIFARVKTDEPIIINTDKKDRTFFYYKNGFVEVTKEGYTLKPYEEMDGSVWDHQMVERNFTSTPVNELADMGFFADFCFLLSNQDEDRFKALCCIIGYLTHSYYEYKLKAILFTDSTLSEDSEGRTGKTLLVKLIGLMRSYCEINGKDFDSTSITKYQDANIGTQLMHLNDVKHKGKFKFDFEDVFNDITEGYIVKKLYMSTFRQMSKFAISTNKTLNIVGGSQRDRILEFEMSSFFSESYSPEMHYKHWFIRDWDETEFNRYDNFMCYCSRMFHTHGLIAPKSINLGERKLLNHAGAEFMEFIDEIRTNLKTTGTPWPGYNGGAMPFITTVEIQDFAIDKKQFYEKIIHDYSDLKKWLSQNKFTSWLKMYSEQRFGVKKPKEWKSNGISLIQFVNETK